MPDLAFSLNFGRSPVVLRSTELWSIANLAVMLLKRTIKLRGDKRHRGQAISIRSRHYDQASIVWTFIKYFHAAFIVLPKRCLIPFERYNQVNIGLFHHSP